MPVYCYKCNICSSSYEIKHRMSEEHEECIKCGAKEIYKVPALLDINTQKSTTMKVGKIVDEYISNTKKDIKKEKKILRSREL